MTEEEKRRILNQIDKKIAQAEQMKTETPYYELDRIRNVRAEYFINAYEETKEIIKAVETTTEKGTAEDKTDSNFYDIKRMIYYELPVLVSRIIHAAFLNCQPGTIIEPEDMRFITPFIEELKETFDIAINGQTEEIKRMTEMHDKQKEDAAEK